MYGYHKYLSSDINDGRAGGTTLDTGVDGCSGYFSSDGVALPTGRSPIIFAHIVERRGVLIDHETNGLDLVVGGAILVPCRIHHGILSCHLG